MVLFTLLSLFLPPSHNDNRLGIPASFPLSAAEQLLQERHLLVISSVVSGASASQSLQLLHPTARAAFC